MKNGLKILAFVLSGLSFGISIVAGIVNDKMLDDKIAKIVDKKIN